MALYPKGKGLVVSSAAATFNGQKIGPGTVVSLAFLGGAGAVIGIYDGETVASGTLIGVFHGLSATVPVSFNPYLLFEKGLSFTIAGTFTGAFVSLTIE